MWFDIFDITVCKMLKPQNLRGAFSIVCFIIIISGIQSSPGKLYFCNHYNVKIILQLLLTGFLSILDLL